MKTTDFITENQFIGDDAHAMHQDHEVQMARSDCYSAAKYAIELHKLLKNISEMQGLDGWVSEKLTLANDYLRTVHEYLAHEMSHPEEAMPEMFTAESAEIQFAELLGETTGKQVDMTGKPCTACKKGTYEETDFHDDMDGVLHCTKCRKQVKRHQPANPNKKGMSEGGRLDLSSPEEKAARKAYIKAHGHPPPLTPDSVVAKYNPENDKKIRDYYLRRKGIPQDKLDKMKEDGGVEQDMDEAFIPPALSAANFNAEFNRTNHWSQHHKGRVVLELDDAKQFDIFGARLNKAAKIEGEPLEYGRSGMNMYIYSKTMDSNELDAFVENAIEEHGGVDEGRGDANRLEHRGAEYNVYFNQRKGMYTARGTGQMSGQIQPEWFHTLADAQDHAEMEIGGYDEHDGVTESDPLANRDAYAKQHQQGQVYKTHYPKGENPFHKAGMKDKRSTKMSAYDISNTGPRGALPESDVAEGELTAYQKLLKQMRQTAKNDPNRIPRGYELTAHGELVKKHKTEKSNDGVGGLGEGLAEAAQGHTIEAHGVRGMDRKTWHKTFKNVDQMNAWAEKYDAEVHGTRDLEQAKRGNLSPAMEGEKKGLYYNVNKRKAAGTSRSASNPKAPTDQAWKDAAKTAKTEGVSETTSSAGMATAPGVGKGPKTGTLFGGSYAPRTPFTGKKKANTSVIKR
jgi:hypothetical protein